LNKIDSAEDGNAADALVAAVTGGDWIAAERMISRLPEPSPAEARRAAGQLHFCAGRWKRAAAIFSSIPRPDLASEIRRRFSANLADLGEYRGEICRCLLEPDLSQTAAIVRGKAARLTLAAIDVTSGKIGACLSRGGDPVSSTMQILTDLKTALKENKPLALCGIGDGYVLAALAKLPESRGGGQAVYIIEPDAGLMRAAMMLHDYSGHAGPIQQARFRWFAGRNWVEQLKRECQGGRSRASMPAIVAQGNSEGEIEPVLRSAFCD
jgi:hypothetical protein